MKANNALIILWQGSKISDYQIGKIMEQLVLSGIAEQQNITVVYKDEDSIANALLRDSAKKGLTVIKTEEPKVNLEAIKNAVIYVGKRFEVSLASTNADLTLFAIELAQTANAAKTTGYEPELLTAIEILSTTSGEIPKSIAKKYHFTQAVVNVIQKVYNKIR